MSDLKTLREHLSALPRYNCDCLAYDAADPLKRPADGDDAIYLERDVVLAEDVLALLDATPPPPVAGSEPESLEGWIQSLEAQLASRDREIEGLKQERDTQERVMGRLDRVAFDRMTDKDAGAVRMALERAEKAEAELSRLRSHVETMEKERADGLYGVERVAKLVQTYAGLTEEVERLRSQGTQARRLAEERLTPEVMAEVCIDCWPHDDAKRLILAALFPEPSAAETQGGK